MEFKTLGHIDITALTTCFNNSFSDYEIPLQFTTEALEQKIRIEDIDLSISVGAFDGSQLVGFSLFAMGNVNGTLCAWDGGTGVMHAYRGQRLTAQMFGYAVPVLKQAGAKAILLEVLKNNTVAYNIYERQGFKNLRELHAYKGQVQKEGGVRHTVEELEGYDGAALLAMGDYLPAWQQMNGRVQNWGDAVRTIGIRQGVEVVAYAHYNHNTRRVLQYAVAEPHRRKGMATALFQYIMGNDEIPVSVVNVDAADAASDAFLQGLGVERFLSQYEMAMDL